MAALAGCRLWGPMAVILCGPLVELGLAAEPAQNAADPQTTAVVHEPSAEELVQQALKAEAAGKSAEREKLLRMAVKKDPNYAPARWHLGYVRVGNEWVAWDEVARRAAGDPRIAEYRGRFDQQAGTPAGELALARWCREKGLEDHARFHWLRLVSFQPQNEEALKALGMRWYQGRLLTHEQIVAARRGQGSQVRQEQQASHKDWTKHWAPRVTRWQRMIQEGDASVDSSIREELEAIKKSSPADFWAAIPGLDAVLMLRSQWPKDADAYRTLSMKWIHVLDNMPERQAALSLARLAVDHPVPEVRTAAADALKKRPKQLYVPQLIARMGTPIEARFTLTALPLGGGVCEQSLFREGIDGDYEATSSHSVSVRGAGPRFDPPPASGSQQTAATRQQDANAMAAQRCENQAQMAQATMKAQAVAAARSAATRHRVEQVNAAVRDTNQRVEAALSRATGIDLGDSPRPWYEWWTATCCSYFDVEKSPGDSDQRPTFQQHSYFDEYLCTAPRPPTSYTPSPPPATPYRVVPPRPPTAPHSHHDWHFNPTTWTWQCCFPRGTMVWSLTGPVPIENVKPGDRVLSQHPITGELAYKPVIGTMTRKPQSVMRISLGSEVIAATHGHPFLVAGEGWKMAKQLKVGMRLHGLPGAVLIDGVEDAGQLKPFYERLTEKPDADASDDLAYNLVVDESHTYFVGQNRVLVFDDMFAALANQAQGVAASAK